jgi:hypothetical protein
MSEQEKALKMLELLKGTGVSFRSFADCIGMNVESLYSYRSCPRRMSKEKALYIIAQIETIYRKEWEYIKQQMASLVQ